MHELAIAVDLGELTYGEFARLGHVRMEARPGLETLEPSGRTGVEMVGWLADLERFRAG